MSVQFKEQTTTTTLNRARINSNEEWTFTAQDSVQDSVLRGISNAVKCSVDVCMTFWKHENNENLDPSALSIICEDMLVKQTGFKNQKSKTNCFLTGFAQT